MRYSSLQLMACTYTERFFKAMRCNRLFDLGTNLRFDTSEKCRNFGWAQALEKARSPNLCKVNLTELALGVFVYFREWKCVNNSP